MTTKHTFYVPPDGIQKEVVSFPASEANHAARVLRLDVGSVVSVVDGCGRRLRVKMVEVSRKRVLAVVEEVVQEARVLAREVTVAAALIKNGNRFETMLEKVAELGATRVAPLITERTEKPRFREDRAQTILVSAMKQSGSSFLTGLDAPAKLGDFVSGDWADTIRLVCHEGVDSSLTLAGALKDEDASRSIVVLIGPEGGFSEREMQLTMDSGFLPVSLGPARLRAETAAIVSVAIISQL